MSATPRPWKRHARNRHHMIVETPENGVRKLIASVATHTGTFTPEEWDENAELIVRAVNNYDALVAALAEMLTSHSMDNVGLEASKRRLAAKQLARDALAKAHGDPA
jgi:hypothetical protein